MKYAYVSIDEKKLPEGLRFDVPRQNQGQIFETAYADERPEASEACNGSRYRRCLDRSDGSVVYYERVT